MKNQSSIKNIEGSVIDACFKAFSVNDSDLEQFIDFLMLKIDKEDAEDLKESITESLTEKDESLFGYSIEYLNLDLQSLQCINQNHNLGLDDLFVDNQLYLDLLFVFSLPETINDLNSEQKSRIGDIYYKLFAKKAELLTNYNFVCNATKESLFRSIKGGLGTISFLKLLRDTLKSISAADELISNISNAGLIFVADFNRQANSEPKIKSRMVSKGIADSQEDLTVSRNSIKSANDTYIVVNKKDGCRYYAKSFDKSIKWEGTISPHEMFLYKVLQYLGVGPKTEFLLESGGALEDASDPCADSFILTNDVCRSDEQFFLDLKENKDYLRKFAEGDGSDEAARKFAVEISAVAALVDILSIADVFGNNGNNYGLVGDPKNPSEYKFQFVDHQPNSDNALFAALRPEEKLAYSPRNSLFKKYLPKVDKSRALSPLAELAVATKKSSNSGFEKVEIQADIYRKLFNEQNNGKSMMENAISKARRDVFNLVSETNSDAFVEGFMGHLDSYIATINENMQSYIASTGKSLYRPSPRCFF